LLALSAVSALAAPIISTDLDTIFGSIGATVVPEITDVFTAAAPPPASIGSATNNVYYDAQSGIYTYTHAVTPTINNISEFNTAFGVNGFNGVAGYSFSESAAAGGPGDGTGFSVELDADATIDWQLDPNNKFWGSGETITFFFQSSYRPGLGDYNMVNGEVGTATSYAPVPEPSTYLLFGSALALLAWRRKKSA
jgi:hypothetical protein